MAAFAVTTLADSAQAQFVIASRQDNHELPLGLPAFLPSPLIASSFAGLLDQKQNPKHKNK
ncbi:MAG: hypothetical protein NT154_04560 [Verrucomicrobia bacterium]|nr:hypothetical protein [Verrucomicrobiota bacterium]